MSTEPSPPTIQEAPPEQPITRTSQLSASDSFDFTSSYDVDVVVNLAGDQNRHLNICHSFVANGDNTKVDYGSCMLQTSLQAGEYSGSLSLTNDITKLVIAVWDYSGADPSYFFWDRTLQGDTLIVN